MKALNLALAWIGIVGAVGILSCSSMPPPVPMVGPSTEVSRLAGNWTGEYSSQETRRHGLIWLTLAANSDTAFGDVLMLPNRLPAQHQGGELGGRAPIPDPRTLSISFVAPSGDGVFGTLEPYQDPDCACTLVTQFWGRLEGDRIQGRYRTTNTRTFEITNGEWSVLRESRLQ